MKKPSATSSRSIRLAPLVLASTLLTPYVSWAGVEIDQMPLTVGKPVEPNLMFILDNSTSMRRTYMPDTVPNITSGPNISHHVYTYNLVYYNPKITYYPWENADGTPYPNANYNAVSTNNVSLSLSGSRNLASDAQCFHELKSPELATNNGNNYWRYKLYGGKLYQCTAVASPTNRDRNNTTEGRPYPYYDACNGSNDHVAGPKRQCTEITGSVTWTDGTNSVTRTIAQEFQNFANWYQYYRTRMKIAKGAASRAFAELDESYRIGFTKIGDSSIYMRIPVGTNDGLFEGTNRTSWFEALLDSTASLGSTPLRTALKRVGDYFANSDSDGPYGPGGADDQLSCRQNFAILTTDGYWNDSFTNATIGNADNTAATEPITGPNGQEYQFDPDADENVHLKDGSSYTLADVAMYYWKTDLRTNLTNNVPTSAKNPAFWQHMRTYGISIGMKGTLDPATDLDAIKAGHKSWPAPTSNNQTTIDDLWHATLNSRGEFLVATNSSELTEALVQTLSSIAAEKGRAASGAASSTNITGDDMTYFSEYMSGTWSGDVRGYEIDPETGRRKTNATKDWSASEQLPAWNLRNIKIASSGSLVNFTWANLTGEQQAALESQDVVNYLRGDRTNEQSTANPNAPFRKRDSLLGDFVNSQPVYVGKPPYNPYYEKATTPGAADYAAHAESKANRTPMLYVGGNDGMLHGFNALTGVEVFAFVPAAVVDERLRSYADPDYEHLYFVDGELTVAEIYDNAWKTVLVGTLGRGGRGVFALDVTDPNNISLLWEKTADDIPNMGNLLGKPTIAEVGPDSDWRVVLGNGPNGDDDSAHLITISLIDGSVSTRATSVSGNNGLSAPLVWDSDKDGLFETVYAGDLKGNVWRFDDIDKNSGNLHRLFTTIDAQPITAAPWAGVNPRDEATWIFVGTGQYLNEEDRTNTEPQTWYGLIDDRSEASAGTTIDASDLVKRTVSGSGEIGEEGNLRAARTVSAGTEAEMKDKRGWYLEFTEAGERMLTPNSFYGSALLGTTFIPDGSDLCSPGGRSALWGINPFTGGRLRQALFQVPGQTSIGGVFPSVLDGLKPILVGVPPISVVADGDRNIAIIHTDPDDSEEFTPPAGVAELQSWREILGE